MKKLIKIFGILVLVVLLGIGGLVAYYGSKWPPKFPEVPFPEITASEDSAIIAEGEYLVKTVAHCTACHLPHDKVFNSTPEQTASLVPTGGGEWKMGPMGTIRSRNLTPIPGGIGEWSDAELARAIRYGVDRSGEPLLFMAGVGPMGDEDLQAIVSYLRTLQPQGEHSPKSEIAILGKVLLQTVMRGFAQPKPNFPVTYVPRGDTSVARGEYLANGPAMCFACHSNLKMSPVLAIDGPPFAGSQQPEPDIDNPDMEINAPNLTPSKLHGIMTNWSEEQFVARIKTGRVVKTSSMPWENFRIMDDADLISIYRYLKTLDPVDRQVGPSYRTKGWKPKEPS